jgi:hypothetical protein
MQLALSPHIITHITIVDSTTTSIGDCFFGNCTNLTTVDLTPLTNVTSIGNYFFLGCTGLTSANLSGLTSLQTIDGYFFFNTPNLLTLTAKADSGINGTLSSLAVDHFKARPDKFTTINLNGNATTVPAWVNEPNITGDSTTLNLSAMTGLTAPFDFATLTNGELTTLTLPNGVATSNTTGWTNTSGETWTR